MHLHSKLFVCDCEQCKAVKNKRKNRRLKVKIKRLLNKRMRRSTVGEAINFYWA
jgi:hypothetical protein